jgi:hypothetical protein
MQLNCVLSDVKKIDAILDMYRNFFAYVCGAPRTPAWVDV